MSSERCGWNFARQLDTEGSSGGTPSEHALDTSLEGLVREAFQNANDEGPINGGPVEVTVHVQEFTGDEKKTFLRALGWTDDSTDGEPLSKHLEQVAEDDAPTARFLEQMDEEDRLVTITFEDENTRGLLGVGGEDKNFAALTLDELNNEKREEAAGGGSWGLGKFSFQAWSGISTVLFTSNLSEPDPRNDDPRFFGHTYLPTHGDDEEDYEYEGDGYFGHLVSDGTGTAMSREDAVLYKWGSSNAERPVSVWGDDATPLVEALQIPRSNDSGTSITIVGASKPGKGAQPDPDELGKDIATAVSKWFWPAMAIDQLEATVVTPSNEINVTPDYCDAVRPFVDAFERRESGDGSLEHPGDVASLHPDIEIPDKADGTPTADGPITITARLADPTADGPEAELQDKVALIRNAGMVVRYYDRNSVVYGDRHFHGLVLAGKARAWNEDGPTDADEDIEDYLMAAEPPSHDDWNSRDATKNQATDYGSGYLERVRDLKRTISSTLRELVGGVSGNGERVAPELADRLGITGRGRPPEREPQAIRATDKALNYDPDTGIWTFDSRISPVVDDHYDWTVTVHLDRLSQKGRSVGHIDIDTFHCPQEGEGVTTTPTDDGYKLEIDASIDEIKITATTTTDASPAETRLQLDGEVVVGGDA